MTPRYLFVLGHYGHMGGAERQALYLIKHLRETRDARVAVLGWYGKEGPLAKMPHPCHCYPLARLLQTPYPIWYAWLRYADFPSILLYWLYSFHSRFSCSQSVLK